MERNAFDLIRNNLGEANFFAFGIGSSVNRYLIEGIAHTGLGEPFIATDINEAHTAAEQFRKYVETPVLTNIKVDYSGFNAYDIEPLNVPDVFAERPVILYGKYNGDLEGTIFIDGLTGHNDYKKSLDLSSYSASQDNKALMYLWARKRIQQLDDYANLTYGDNQDIIAEVTALGLKYNLLTSYTSFVVVDSVIRCDTCNAETVNQPLPMPEGVTDDALGWGSPVSSLGYADESTNRKTIQSETETLIESVFPNPITDEFVVSIRISGVDKDQNKFISIYDNLGRLVSRIELTIESAGIHDIFLSISEEVGDLVSGQYYLQLQVGSWKSDREVIFILR